MSEFDDLIPEFIAESTDLLEEVESGLLRLENFEAESDAIHTIFRAIHSIKGGAGFVGLEKIEKLAHKMEDVLNLVRNGDLIPNSAITDALLNCNDVLSKLFDQPGNHENIDVAAPIQKLDIALGNSLDQEVKADVDAVSGPAPSAGLPSFEVSSYFLKNKMSQGNVYYIRLNLSQIEEQGLTPMQVVQEMLSMGEILDSKVDLGSAGDLEKHEEMEVAFDVLYFTVLEGDLLEAALKLAPDDYRPVKYEDFQFEGDSEEAEAQVEEPAPEPETPEPEAEPAAAAVEVVETSPAIRQEATPPAVVVEEAIEAKPATKGGEYLTLTLGKEHYGVDILSVQEIIGLPKLAILPLTPPHVLGVINLRGMVVPVVDLRVMLGLSTDTEDSVVIVLLIGDKTMGAVVDGVTDVVQLEDDQVQDPPEFAGAVRREFLKGLTRIDHEMIILLEIEKLMSLEILADAR